MLALWQAVDAGISAATVQRRAREGSWERLHPAVYLLAGHRLTDEARVRAAWLWAGEKAVVSGPAAAYWHGMLNRAPRPVEITVPRARSPRCPAGVRVRRRDLAAADVVGQRDLWLTAAPLTALETAVALADGSVFLDRALHGSSAAGRLLVAAADRAESTAERLLVAILRGAGIGGWVLGHPFGPWRIDLAFPEQKVAVEVDGWAWHVDADRFRADRRKQNALVRAGWDPLRFTWHDLDRRPTAVLDEIEETLRLAEAPSRPRSTG